MKNELTEAERFPIDAPTKAGAFSFRTIIDYILATALALFAVFTTLIAAAGAITVVVLGVMLW